MKWFRIDQEKPVRGARIIVFTPVESDLRYRVCDSDLLKTMSEATHFAYLAPPDDHWVPLPQKVRGC